MVIFTNSGVIKLKDIALGVVTLKIVGDISKYCDELSLLLTKMSVVTNTPSAGALQHIMGSYYLGNNVKGAIEVTVEDLFTYFEVTVFESIPKELISARNMGFAYSTEYGEPVQLSNELGVYTFNDGSTIGSGKVNLSKLLALKKECFATYMPELAALQKNATKLFKAKAKSLGLTGLTEGSSIRIRQYEELIKTYGEQVLVMGEDDLPQLVESSDDPKALRFIRALGYARISADYYNGKTGTVEAIDFINNLLTLRIDGETVHNKFMDDGEVLVNDEEAVIFGLEHIELV